MRTLHSAVTSSLNYSLLDSFKKQQPPDQKKHHDGAVEEFNHQQQRNKTPLNSINMTASAPQKVPKRRRSMLTIAIIVFMTGAMILMGLKYQTMLLTTSTWMANDESSGLVLYGTVAQQNQQLQDELSKALHLVKLLNDTLDIANRDHQTEQEELTAKLQEAGSSSKQQASAKAMNEANSDEHDFCELLPQGSTQDIWMSHLSQLLEHSIHPFDKKERNFVDLHAHVLHLLSTERFDRSLQGSLPHRQWSSIQSALQITRRRQLAILEQKRTGDNTTALSSRLNIVVMGGSVAEGDKCESRYKAVQQKMRRRNCAWPFRLQFLLDRFLGSDDIVKVTTATVGGTNSEAALVLLEYDLIPLPLSQVDILIHAYATNDMHAYTQESAAKNNVTLRDRVFDLTEQFVRRALHQPHPQCAAGRRSKKDAPPAPAASKPSPLIMYLNDYLGNEQNGLLDTAVIAQTIPFLTNYYGIHYTSYADAVRDLVYSDTGERTFSPYWKIMNETTGVLFREVHPGMGAHVGMAFTMLYHFLHLTVTHCQNRYDVQEEKRWDPVATAKGKAKEKDYAGNRYSYNTMDGLLPELKGSFPMEKHFKLPLKPPKVMPPPLYPNMTLDTVSKAWRGAAESRDCSNTPHYENACIYAWVSRISENCMVLSHLNSIVATNTVTNQGWEAQYEFKKMGLIPTLGRESLLVLQFPNLTQPISSIMMMVLKSYGPKWENSTVRLQAFASDAPTVPVDNETSSAQWRRLQLSMDHFAGYHGKNTSEQYSYVTKLVDGPVPVGDHLRLSIQLVGGNTSKIMGMAVCSA
jgi:hypothetical protein